MQATRTSTTLAALATLAALGLAAQPAAHAATGNSLTLNTGDAITVNSSGTAGHIGATLYAPPNAMTTINAGSANQAVQTNGASTFTLGTGGTLKGGAYGLDAVGNGPVTVSGGAISGFIDGLYATGGTVTVSGGAISGGAGAGLDASTGSTVTVSGGAISGSYGLDASTGSTVTVSGGTLNGDISGLYASTGSTVTVSGGTIGGRNYGLFVQGGTVTVSGGAISGFNDGLSVTSGGTISLFSLGDTPFLINNVPMNNTTLAHYTSGTNTISGTLLDGDKFSTNFYDIGTINLNVGTPPGAPEPTQPAALALGALGLSALARRRRAA